jgi:hypothetical protein
VDSCESAIGITVANARRCSRSYGGFAAAAISAKRAHLGLRHITLKAAPDAPAVEKQLVPVMAHVSVNFVMKMTYCAEPFFVTVASGQ